MLDNIGNRFITLDRHTKNLAAGSLNIFVILQTSPYLWCNGEMHFHDIILKDTPGQIKVAL